MCLPQREENSVMWKEKINNAKWKNLYLIRHGESTCNEVNRFGGALGEAQAKKARGQWRRRLINVIWVSSLLHVWTTAQILFSHNATAAKPKLIIDKRITKRNFCSADMPEGEHFETSDKRILGSCLDKLYDLITQDQTVLLVAYQYVIGLLSQLILGIPVAGGCDLRLPNAAILNAGELGHYVHQKSRKMNRVQGWIFNVLMLGVGLALSQLSIVTDNFLPLIKLGPSLTTGLSLSRVDMSSRWSSNNGMFSLKRIFFLFTLVPLTVQELALLFPQHYSLSFFFLLLALPTACTGTIVCRSLGAPVLPTAYAIVMTTLFGVLITLLLLTQVALPA